MIKQEAIAGKLVARTFYPAGRFGLVNTDVSAGVGGQKAQVSVAAVELNGLTMATGDDIYMWLDPKGDLWDFDLTKDLHVALVIESAGGAADADIDFTVHLKGVAATIALTDAKVSADGTITFDAVTITTVGGIQVVPAKHANVAGLFSADEMILMAITLADSGDASADEIRLIAVRVFGTLKFCTDVASEST